MSQVKTYRGFQLRRGRTFQDWCVYFPELRRVRYGTLQDVRADVDAVVSGAGLPAPMRGGF